MKADFEKGTKICSRCRRELPINCFSKNKFCNDGLQHICKDCQRYTDKQYRCKNIERIRNKQKIKNDKYTNTFQKKGNCRGNSGMLKRDYELTEEQLKRREKKREGRNFKPRNNAQGVLVWYDGNLNNLSSKEYLKIMDKEYKRQKNCAVRGYVGITQPSEHFLFDFDFEQMLKDNVYFGCGNNRRCYITKWWKGEIRHWTVNDGIWKEG